MSLKVGDRVRRTKYCNPVLDKGYEFTIQKILHEGKIVEDERGFSHAVFNLELVPTRWAYRENPVVEVQVLSTEGIEPCPWIVQSATGYVGRHRRDGTHISNRARDLVPLQEKTPPAPLWVVLAQGGVYSISPTEQEAQKRKEDAERVNYDVKIVQYLPSIG